MKTVETIEFRLECMRIAERITPSKKPAGTTLGVHLDNNSKDIDTMIDNADKIYNWIKE